MRYARFALVAILALVSVPTALGQPPPELVLRFVEIGQGDCTLIECPNGGFIILVDAGSTARGDRAAVRDYGDSKDCVVATAALTGGVESQQNR